MSKFILFNEQSTLAARYDSDIHGAAIPQGAVEVSDELFSQTINEQDGIWSLVNGEIVKLPFPLPTIGELIASKRREVNMRFEAAMQQIIAGIPSNEISSWSKQEAEARAFTADTNASTPLINALATARGIGKLDLAQRIIAKADLFAVVSGQLIGYRQSLEDQLDVLASDINATAEQVEAIVWAL